MCSSVSAGAPTEDEFFTKIQKSMGHECLFLDSVDICAYVHKRDGAMLMSDRGRKVGRDIDFAVLCIRYSRE